MKIIETLAPHHVPQLHQLYLQQWWSNTRTLNEVEAVLTGSSITLGMVDDDNALIGFTRVLTDGIFKALIFDVIVNQEYRGHKIGSQLVQYVKAHPKLSRVKHLELYCLPELQSYYQQFGFAADVGGMELMRLTMR
ncbi:GNAT family N-acetyltransferase [Cellvibrio mixtus]|uniref:GNAT family N-acetyltransferase n=1 Tax=Cellvibrio mixtus TaxID=39650 RepID=A0A266Q3C4_9GAMM|nr:GNAT family N-acetyltransferase [Cellvibrio mixtus]OZY83859.1 GNAT family N-acetyltransferase [Cellvibrio mixtus]